MGLTRHPESTFTMGTHIYFRNHGPWWGGKEHKTNLYQVHANADNFLLGEIKWFGRWRKYVFEPAANTIYEETCMRDISQFIEEETATQRANAKAKKAAKA
jgi:hypothetical protein